MNKARRRKQRSRRKAELDKIVQPVLDRFLAALAMWDDAPK